MKAVLSRNKIYTENNWLIKKIEGFREKFMNEILIQRLLMLVWSNNFKSKVKDVNQVSSMKSNLKAVFSAMFLTMQSQVKMSASNFSMYHLSQKRKINVRQDFWSFLNLMKEKVSLMKDED